MTSNPGPTAASAPRDLVAGLVVALVAIPLCLGVAVSCKAPPFAGLLAGVVGGIVVGLISGSRTSVSGPALGLTLVVAVELTALREFPTFLLALVYAGLFQIGFAALRAGAVAAFFPSSVIKGLIAAVGIILILKQIPHVLGDDLDPEGDFAFLQTLDHQNTLSELLNVGGNITPGAVVIGLLSLVVLFTWDRIGVLRRSPVPAPLVVIVLGAGLAALFQAVGGVWVVGPTHFLQVPASTGELLAGFQTPDFSKWASPAVLAAAFALAAVASLETLMHLEAADDIDPRQANSPRNRELLAQGIGNLICGFLGGLPVSSIVVRTGVNIDAGGRSRLSAIAHGVFLLVGVSLLPSILNAIPISCLAAILLATGVRLASPVLFRRMWDDGRYQFVPFAVTVLAIFLTDLLVGVLIGLTVSVGFILRSNLRRPIRRVEEKHPGGTVLRVELANQVSFLNRATLAAVLDDVPEGGHVLLDASDTDYIDPDILALIRDYKDRQAPARGVEVSLVGFRSRYQLDDQIQYVDYTSRELQESLAPDSVLQILKDGHERFRTGRRLTRDLGRQAQATAAGQHPLAVVLSCIDSRAPAELIFDLGVGDIFSIRVAGNITSRKILGSMEYACAVAGAKLVLVMGHTRCGAVTAAVDLAGDDAAVASATGCQHLGHVVGTIRESVGPATAPPAGPEKEAFVNAVARRNVARMVGEVVRQSETMARLVSEGKVAIVGAMYDVTTRKLDFVAPEEG